MVKGQTHLSQHYQVLVLQWESEKGQGWRVQSFLDLILRARRLSRDPVPFFPRERTVIMETTKKADLQRLTWPALVFGNRTQCVSGTWGHPRAQGAIWCWTGKSRQYGVTRSCMGLLTLLISSIVPLTTGKRIHHSRGCLNIIWMSTCESSQLLVISITISVLKAFGPCSASPCLPLCTPCCCCDDGYCTRNRSAKISLTCGLHCVKTKSIFTRQYSLQCPWHLPLPVLLSSSAVSSSLR